MQARIEPRFLFNTLMRVKRLYRREPKLAESMLDELGAFLRAAMPRMRDSSSTVRQETVLVQAYLGIVRVRRRNGIDYAVEVAPHAAEGRLPSMMLLPLVDHAVAHAMRASAGNLRLRLCASVADGRLRLAISTSAISVPERGGAAIAAIRERLDALYRGDASLALGPSATGGMQAVLDIPFQRDADEEKSRAH
jgi:LytS/YehU family sensor histidine kinase